MAPDSELRGRIERVVREGLRLRRDLPKAELERRLAPAVEAIAEIAANIKGGLTYHQTPAFGFAEAKEAPEPSEALAAKTSNEPWPQSFGRGVFAEGAEAWAEPDREHAFRKVGRTETEEQLQALAAAREATIKALDCLSESALLLLAYEGISIAQERLEETAKIKKIEEVLAANLKYVPEKQVRQPVTQTKQKLVAALAEAYLDLTGKHPGRSRRSNEKKLGSFHLFADCMFAVIGLEPPSDFMVKAACKFVAKKSPICPPFSPP